jgi:hypothetical protein
MVGTRGKPNAGYVSQELNVLANNGAVPVPVYVECEKHRTAVGAEMSSTKLTLFVPTSGRKLDGAVLKAEGAFAFHSVKEQSN